MKAFSFVMKVVAALAAVAGVVYVIATYGDKIVAGAKKLLGMCCGCDCEDCECNEDGECCCPCECDNCDCCDCEGECECDGECDCECNCEEAAEEAAEETVEANEADFEG